MNRTERIDELRRLQRARTVVLKSRIMVSNRIQATVAGGLGYDSHQDEKERERYWREAGLVIKAVAAGEDHAFADMILAHDVAIQGLLAQQRSYESDMVAEAKELPVAGWVGEPEQRGFGLLNLAIIVGECGGLENYSNPGKVWRRMGCAPYTTGGKTAMGGTWRGGREGKLTAAEWSDYGYSPRRRSIVYNVAEPLLKQNGDGPYRHRYDVKKAEAAERHPDWSKQRCHLHGMLLIGKLLLKALWIAWNQEAGGGAHETEPCSACLV
jgi:hypothetical protein